MKKMHFFGLLALALVLALSVAFVACSSGSDDDDDVVGQDYLRVAGVYNALPAEMIISHTSRAAYTIANDDYYVFRYYDGDKPGEVISRGRITYAAPNITFRPDGGAATFNGYISEGKLIFTYTGWNSTDNQGGGSNTGGGAPVYSVAVTPSTASLTDTSPNNTATFSATVTLGGSTTGVSQYVQWTVVGATVGTGASATTNPLVTGTGISSTGVLTIGTGQTGAIVVKATSPLSRDPGQASVTVGAAITPALTLTYAIGVNPAVDLTATPGTTVAVQTTDTVVVSGSEATGAAVTLVAANVAGNATLDVATAWDAATGTLDFSSGTNGDKVTVTASSTGLPNISVTFEVGGSSGGPITLDLAGPNGTDTGNQVVLGDTIDVDYAFSGAPPAGTTIAWVLTSNMTGFVVGTDADLTDDGISVVTLDTGIGGSGLSVGETLTLTGTPTLASGISAASIVITIIDPYLADDVTLTFNPDGTIDAAVTNIDAGATGTYTMTFYQGSTVLGTPTTPGVASLSFTAALTDSDYALADDDITCVISKTGYTSVTSNAIGSIYHFTVNEVTSSWTTGAKLIVGGETLVADGDEVYFEADVGDPISFEFDKDTATSLGQVVVTRTSSGNGVFADSNSGTPTPAASVTILHTETDNYIIGSTDDDIVITALFS